MEYILAQIIRENIWLSCRFRHLNVYLYVWSGFSCWSVGIPYPLKGHRVFKDIGLGPVGISQVLWRPLPFWSGSGGPDCAEGHLVWSYEWHFLSSLPRRKAYWHCVSLFMSLFLARAPALSIPFSMLMSLWNTSLESFRDGFFPQNIFPEMHYMLYCIYIDRKRELISFTALSCRDQHIVVAQEIASYILRVWNDCGCCPGNWPAARSREQKECHGSFSKVLGNANQL